MNIIGNPNFVFLKHFLENENNRGIQLQPENSDR